MLGDELEALSAPFILVLDDFHRITNVDIYVLLDRLLAYPPRSLHLVILTRQDPPLRIAAMRASGLAVEIRFRRTFASAMKTRAVLHNVADVTPDPDTLASIKVDLGGVDCWPAHALPGTAQRGESARIPFRPTWPHRSGPRIPG